MRAALSLALVLVSVTSAVPVTVQETESHRVKAEGDDYPRLPGATLLIGVANSLLVVTTPSDTVALQPELNRAATEWGDAPSISRDGRIVGAARLIADGTPRLMGIGTYSIPERKWTQYAEATGAGAVAISPDGSKLAYGGEEILRVIDLKTGESRAALPAGNAWRLSWSPDGRRIVYQHFQYEDQVNGNPRAINVVDTETGEKARIADGHSPAWSPSGDWIAYLDDADGSRTRCMAVRPDGTGAKTLFDWRTPLFQRFLFGQPRRWFIGAPVWSPDSTQMLLTELLYQQRTPVMQIHLLDVATRKLTHTFTAGWWQIYGWSS